MRKHPTLIRFGEIVKIHRKANNLSQEELAAAVGLHRTYIGMIERGEKNITLLNMIKICRSFNLTISELLKELDG